MTIATNAAADTGSEGFYVLSPEKGLCLVGDAIINLGEISVIRKEGGKTLVYRSGVPEPIQLPENSFEVIRNTIFATDDADDDDDDFDDDDEDEEDE